MTQLLTGTLSSLRESGPRAAMDHFSGAVRAYRRKQRAANYDLWFKNRLRERLAKSDLSGSEDGPLLSVVVPVSGANPRLFGACVGSVRSQTYSKWQLVLVPFGRGDGLAVSRIQRWAARDTRITGLIPSIDRGHAEATNLAIQASEGEFVCLLDEHDTLTPDALHLAARALKDEPDVDLVYGDQDRRSSTNKLVEPSFRPRPSLDLLLATHYMTHPLAVRRRLVVDLGGMRPQFGPSAEHDLVLRLHDAGGRSTHIREVTYHQQAGEQSTVGSDDDLPFDKSGLVVVRESLLRRQLNATARRGVVPGSYEILFRPPPLGSLGIVIYSQQDVMETLDNLRYVVVPDLPGWQVRVVVVRPMIHEDGVTDDLETEDWPQRWTNVEGRVALYRGWPNRAAALNWGSRFLADSDCLLFVEDDIVVTNPPLLGQVLGNLNRPDVGIVGTTEVGPDGLVKQSGIIANKTGVGYAYAGKDTREMFPDDQWRKLRDVAAVSGSFLLTKARVFAEVGGFPEDVGMRFFDVAFCLNVRQRLGLRVVLDPLSPVIKKGDGRLIGPQAPTQDNEEREFAALLERDADERDETYFHSSLSFLLYGLGVQERAAHQRAQPIVEPAGLPVLNRKPGGGGGRSSETQHRDR